MTLPYTTDKIGKITYHKTTGKFPFHKFVYRFPAPIAGHSPPRPESDGRGPVNSSAQDRRDTLSSAYRFFRHIFPSPSCILRPDGRMPAVPFLKQIHEKLSLSIRQHRAVKSRNKPSAARFRKSRHRTALSLSHYNNGRYGTEILRKLRNAPPPKRYPAPLSCLTALGGSGFPATERLQTEA